MLHFLLLLYITGTLSNDVPMVETSLGKLTGYHKTSYGGRVFSAFEGIPYAEPPVGDLRFEGPKRVKAWNGILNATSTYVCKQADNPFMLGFGSDGTEDCLYLNVYIPKSQPSKNDNLDVIVNIHGGAFMIGAGSFAGPSYIMDRDVVYVNLNYRLGILGFLSTEDTVVPGNNGLKDQQMAMKWVQEHIHNFGGNPQSVTLMGLSAGGASVHFHFFSPDSRGLFHSAISQSGSALMPWAIQEGALEKTRKLADLLDCQNSKIENVIKCLKKVPVDNLVKKTNHFYTTLKQTPLAPFAPVVEVKSKSSFITKHPYKQLEAAEMYDVPWLTWISKDEGMLGLMQAKDNFEKIDKEWDQLAEHLFDYYYTASQADKVGIAHKIKDYYFKNMQISENNLNPFVKAMGDRYFNVGFETAVKMQAKASKSPVYAGLYAFQRSSGSLAQLLGLNFEGVPHGDDGFLLHDAIFLPMQGLKLSNSDEYIKDLLLNFIASFAKEGKPKSDEINWNRVTKKVFNYLLIHDVDDVKMIETNELTPIGFWESLNLLENSKSTPTHDEL